MGKAMRALRLGCFPVEQVQKPLLWIDGHLDRTIGGFQVRTCSAPNKQAQTAWSGKAWYQAEGS